MKLEQKGFSLAEVMIAGGLLGLIALGAMHIMKSNVGIEKRGDIVEGNNRSLLELSKLVHKVQKAVSWDEFDYAESYFENEGSPIQVTWNIDDIKWADNRSKLAVDIDGETFYKSSNLLTIPLFNGKSSVLFSRCVEKDYIDKEYSIGDAYKLSKVPMLVKNGKSLEVNCCSRKTKTTCSDTVSSDDSGMRVKTFYYRNGKLKTYPLEADKKFTKGTGFFLTFDKIKNPTSFKMVFFNQIDSCYYKDRNCESTYVLKPKTIAYSLKTQGVQDSGFIEMN